MSGRFRARALHDTTRRSLCEGNVTGDRSGEANPCSQHPRQLSTLSLSLSLSRLEGLAVPCDRIICARRGQPKDCAPRVLDGSGTDRARPGPQRSESGQLMRRRCQEAERQKRQPSRHGKWNRDKEMDTSTLAMNNMQEQSGPSHPSQRAGRRASSARRLAASGRPCRPRCRPARSTKPQQHAAHAMTLAPTSLSRASGCRGP